MDSIEFAACGWFVAAAPLFEEEGEVATGMVSAASCWRTLKPSACFSTPIACKRRDMISA